MSMAFKPLKPKVVLGVGAHPDDLDFCMGGSVARWAAEGAEIYYYILTNGNKGAADWTTKPAELTATRHQEQQAAARILGVKEVFFGDYEDAALTVTQELKRAIVRTIRRLKPDVVMTFDPTTLYSAAQGLINHPDHRAAGQATLDAVFPLARDHLAFSELIDEGLGPHKTATVLLFNFNQQNHHIDITAQLDAKLRAIAAHHSQVADVPNIQKQLKGIAETAGEAIGVRFAEAFMRIDIQ